MKPALVGSLKNGDYFMPEVRIAEKRLWVGNESRALLSGEVHYWRLAPARWRTILDRVREMGLDVISSYICWQYHEVAEGQLDFRGATEPQRDGVFYVIAVNNSDTAQDVIIELDRALFRPGAYQVRDLSTGVEGHATPHETGHISLFIQAKDGTIASLRAG
jgi:hypothetical protein